MVWLDEDRQPIFNQYKYALMYIGVDFNREDVIEALQECFYDFESVLQSIISYWKYKRENIEYPSAAFIKAVQDQWKPFEWDSRWLDDPRFKSPGQIWWEEAEIGLGRDRRNYLIADTIEPESQPSYVLFRNGRTVRLSVAQRRDWDDMARLAQE